MVRLRNHAKAKKGFTIIEVLLFISITMAIMVFVIGSITRSVHVQRYRDTTQDLSEFLRSVYSAVGNVENVREDGTGMNTYCSIASMWNGTSVVKNNEPLAGDAFSNYPGRSKCVIYGKALTFGELKADGSARDSKTIYEYDVIGTIYNGRSLDSRAGTPISSTIDSLKVVKADVVAMRGTGTSCHLDTAGYSRSYSPQWEGWVENGDGNPKQGTLVIIRSPHTGTVETYFTDRVLDVQAALTDNTSTTNCDNPDPSFSNYQNQFLQGAVDTLSQGDFYFCINSDDRPHRRRAVRIVNNGNNSSAVELLPLDDALSEEKCP